MWRAAVCGAAVIVSAAALTITGAVPGPGAPGPALAASSISQFPGVDACDAPSLAQMQGFWDNTPYYNMGIYIGGSLRACGQANLTASWLQQAGPSGMGWHFMPIWVGPQAPCTSFSQTFSSDPATAYQQGRSEAISAYETARNLGMDTPGMPITYDLEYFDSTNAGCLAAAEQFIQGWVDQLHTPDAQLAGLYTTSCSLPGFAGLATPPDFVWGASWDGDASVQDMPCVPAGDWIYSQRHKQYQGGHDETWNGVTLNVDSDCSDGPVYPAGDELGSSPCTAAPAAPVLDAARLTPRRGWVLTPRSLLLTSDGGRSFRPVAPPVPAGSQRAAFFLDPRHGWVASCQGGLITVARTADGGRTWRVARLPAGGPRMAPVGSLRLSFGSQATGGLLVQRVSSSNFSLATLYVSTDGGASWHPRKAPGAGPFTVRADGTITLDGGPGPGTPYRSSDLGTHWARAPRPAHGLRRPTAPAGSSRVSYASRAAGWALAVTHWCSAKRGPCTTTWSLLATGNGGRSWDVLRRWRPAPS